jgi:hypothetical protein
LNLSLAFHELRVQEIRPSFLIIFLRWFYFYFLSSFFCFVIFYGSSYIELVMGSWSESLVLKVKVDLLFFFFFWIYLFLFHHSIFFPCFFSWSYLNLIFMIAGFLNSLYLIGFFLFFLNCFFYSFTQQY